MRALHLLCAVSTLSACAWDDDRSIVWDRTRSLLGPISLKSQIAYVDSALDRVTLVDVADDTPRITTAKIGRRAIQAIASPDRHHLFVVTRGEEAIHHGEIDQPPMLWAIDSDNPTVPPVAYEIGSPVRAPTRPGSSATPTSSP